MGLVSTHGTGGVPGARGGVKSFSYDTNGNLLTERDELGKVTTHAYDARGNLLPAIEQDDSSARWRRRAYSELPGSVECGALPHPQLPRTRTNAEVDYRRRGDGVDGSKHATATKRADDLLRIRRWVTGQRRSCDHPRRHGPECSFIRGRSRQPSALTILQGATDSTMRVVSGEGNDCTLPGHPVPPGQGDRRTIEQ